MAVPMRHRWLNRLLAGTLCVVAVCVVQQAAVLMAADWRSSETRHTLGKWSRGVLAHTPAEWEQARESLQAALALTPRDATLHEAMAQLYSVQGRALWTTGEAGSPEVAAYEEAVRHQQMSLQLRPQYAMGWANLALVLYATNSPEDEVFEAWREAARLGPREDSVTQTLISIATEIWAIAPSDVQQWCEVREPGLSARMDAAAKGKS